MIKNEDTPQEPPAGWMRAIEQGEADIAAGRTVAWADIRVDMLARLETLEAKHKRRRA